MERRERRRGGRRRGVCLRKKRDTQLTPSSKVFPTKEVVNRGVEDLIGTDDVTRHSVVELPARIATTLGTESHYLDACNVSKRHHLSGSGYGPESDFVDPIQDQPTKVLFGLNSRGYCASRVGFRRWPWRFLDALDNIEEQLR